MLLHSCRSNSPALAARSLVFPSRSPRQEETRDRDEGSAVNRYYTEKREETRGEKQKERERKEERGREGGSLRENDEGDRQWGTEEGRKRERKRGKKKR